VPGCDLVVDSLESETDNNQIAGRATGPKIWVSTVSETETEDNQIATAAVPSRPEPTASRRDSGPRRKPYWRAL
jgi:hypothetical protein